MEEGPSFTSGGQALGVKSEPSVCFRPIADVVLKRQASGMGKRSGVPHTDAELEKLSADELQAELHRSRVSLTITRTARGAKQIRKRIHWLEAALSKRA